MGAVTALLHADRDHSIAGMALWTASGLPIPCFLDDQLEDVYVLFNVEYNGLKIRTYGFKY